MNVNFDFSKNLDKVNKENDKLNTEKEKRRIARKKERRATLILGKNKIMLHFSPCKRNKWPMQPNK